MISDNNSNFQKSIKTNKMDNYKQFQESLWKEYNKLFPNSRSTILDGVICHEEYAKSPVKVMFLNREAYDKPDISYDLIEESEERISSDDLCFGNTQRNLRKRIWERLVIARMLPNISNATLNECVESIKNWSHEQFLADFRGLAYVNVKKSDGKPKSFKPNLKEYAQRGIEILKRQIAFYNPTIIYSGDVYDDVLYELLDWGEDIYIDAPKYMANVFQVKIDGKLYPFVDTSHPSARDIEGVSTADYYKEIFRCLKAAESAHPGFWASHINQPCF